MKLQKLTSGKKKLKINRDDLKNKMTKFIIEIRKIVRKVRISHSGPENREIKSIDEMMQMVAPTFLTV